MVTRFALTRRATLLLGVLAILWPASPPSAADALSPSAWRVVSIAGTDATHGETLDLRDGKIGGKAACNRYFASYTSDGAKLAIGPIGATRMHCADRMAAEQALFAALGRVAGHVREGDRLVLTDAAGAPQIVLTRAP